MRRREAGFAAKKESSVAAQDLVASKAAADATAPSRQAEGVGAVAPLGETKGRAEGAGAPAAAAAPAMAKLRATMDAASQRGSRQAPATAVLEEHIPDPRASAIGCRTVRFGEWLPALTGVRAPMLVALDSQRVAVGWRRARLLDPADARARAPGTWLVEGDSARMGLPDVGEGQALRAAINIRSGAGTAAVLGAKGDVHSRATASWIVEACGSR